MDNDNFTIMLDRREGHSVRGAEVGGTVLRGQPIYIEGSTGVADSIEAVIAGLVQVPTYQLIAGRAHAGKDDQVWSQRNDSYAERITALDKDGIFGEKGAVYALDIQNGGLFAWNPQRIREAVQGGNLVNYALQLDQKEVSAVLDAMKRNDTEALKELVHGGNVAFAGEYNGFLEASTAPDFLQGMETTYLVLRPASEARKLESGYQGISKQRENPDIVIASGGKVPAGKMLDQAKGFGWDNFGAWHDGYKNDNTGRVVALNDYNGGVVGGRDMDSNGRSVGVAPEALDAFYRQKDADPLAMKVNQAIRTAKPVQHDDGVILYVPSVQTK